MRPPGGIVKRHRPECVLAVLVSGNGSNLQAIIDRIDSGEIEARIACVISNCPAAYALIRAKTHGIPTVIHENRSYPGRREYDAALVDILRSYNVNLVVLAGFMRILSSIMVEAYPNAIMNVHPALLPSFQGLHAQQQALNYGVKYSGCTVHFVDCGTDTGPIILQAVVAVEPSDTEETLSSRIQAEEHRIFPEAIRLFSEGKLVIDERLVRLQP
jgi:phosphoribosylglycinamide formyltransferase-1